MGFCRRCGNIVSEGPLCTCGGSSVSGLVASRVGQNPSPDRWSRIYTRNDSPVKSSFGSRDSDGGSSSSTSVDGFPVRRVTALSTVGVRGPSILASKSTPSIPISLLPALPQTSEEEAGITADITLTNIFGSMLQDSESFTNHACIECKAEFPPDSTIYPDPEEPTSSRYLCYSCFVLNGGSKGDCSSCERPVLILKAEGKFIKYDNRYWHADCFRCRGCLKDLNSRPEVDLLGNPCCGNCFDTCATYAKSSDLNRSETEFTKGGKEHSEDETVVDELVQHLQGCSTTPSPKRSASRRPSSTKNSPSTTPVRSARRISRGEHKQSPRNASGQGQTSDENANSLERKTILKLSQLSDRDVFGPVQVNGISKTIKQSNKVDMHSGVANAGFPIMPKGGDNRMVVKIEDTPEPHPPQSPGRFRTPIACPGCHLTVSPMERGVVPGPQGTRWHAACLVCGAKRTGAKEKWDGCGKKLDSSAKTDKAGRLFCRNCLNELPREMRPSPQTSPIRNLSPIKPTNTGPGSAIFATRGPGASTLVKQITGNGTSSIPTHSLNRSPSPTSPLRASVSAIEFEFSLPTITKHATGSNIAKLTQQLTGNGLTFLTGGSRPQVPETVRSTSPETTALDTVAEEEDGAMGRQSESFSKSTSAHFRSPSKGSSSWAIARQFTGRMSPTRQLSNGPSSPTRTTFSRRPKSLLGSRHGHHKSLDERESRGMFLVRQMTGNGTAI